MANPEVSFDPRQHKLIDNMKFVDKSAYEEWEKARDEGKRRQGEELKEWDKKSRLGKMFNKKPVALRGTEVLMEQAVREDKEYDETQGRNPQKQEDVLRERAKDDELKANVHRHIYGIEKFNTGQSYGLEKMRDYQTNGDPHNFVEALNKALELAKELEVDGGKSSSWGAQELRRVVGISVVNLKYNIEQDYRKNERSINEAAFRDPYFFEALVGFQKFFEDSGNGQSEELKKIIELVEETKKVRGNNP